MARGRQRHRGLRLSDGLRSWARPEGPPLVLVDGSGRRAWASLANELPADPVDVCTTSDGWALAAAVHAAAVEGVRFFVCCGGESAWRAVAAGLADLDGDGHYLVAHGGGPASIARSFGLPADAPRCARVVLAGQTAHLDTIRIEPRRGEPTEVVNAVWWGFGRAAGFVAGAGARWPLGLRLACAYQWHDPLDLGMGEMEREYTASGMLVANGQFLGDLDVAPRAHPGDGRLEVLVFEGRATDMWRMLPRLRTGTHLPHPRVRELRPATVTVRSAGRIFGDGVDVGRCPATISVRPHRLRVAI